MSHDFEYCTRCYTTPIADLKPFSFCEECWVKHGKPQAVKA